MSHTVGVYGGDGFSSPLAQNDEVLIYCNPLEHQSAPARGYHPSSVLAPTPQRLELRHVRMPQHNDVLCGKGNGTKHHPGNVSYRAIVTKHKIDCVMAEKFHKPMYARAVVHEVRYKNPPGRFLMKGDLRKGENPALFYDIGDDAAIRKAAQALREGAVKIRDKKAKTLRGSNSTVLPREEFLLTTNSNTMVDGPRTNSNATTGPPRLDSFIQDLSTLDEQVTLGGSGVVSPPNYMTHNADPLAPKIVDLTGKTLSSALDDVASKMSTGAREGRNNPRQISILEGDIGSQFLNSDSLIEDFPPGDIGCYEPTSGEKVAERPLYYTGHHREDPHRVSVAAPDKSLLTTSANLGSSNEETTDLPPLNDVQIHDTDPLISDSLDILSQGLSSSIENLSLGRRQSELSNVSGYTWKVGDDPESDQESGPEEDFPGRFNNRSHRTKNSLESSFVRSNSVPTDCMTSIVSSFIHDAASVEGDIDTNSLYPISRASSEKRDSSSFGQLIKSIRSRKHKRRISIQDYIDMGPNKKVRLRESSNLYPIGYDLFHLPGIYQELMKNISSISSFTPDEDDNPNDAFVRDSGASDEMRNWISKEICISEKERISELITEEDNFNEQDYTDEEAFDIASVHLMSGYTEDHGYLHQTHLSQLNV